MDLKSVFAVTEAWNSTYPGAAVGVLVMRDVKNPRQHKDLDTRKDELERDLRSRFAGYERSDLKALPILEAYKAYYKQFKKTYHVQHQLESIVFKDKSIPKVAALVEAMFMAELKNLLLTAGHDFDVVQPPVRIDVADGSESYIKLNGEEQVLKARDMMISDTEGILSSILYGPDQRTQLTPETKSALFTVYAPPGIDEQVVYDHLVDIRENVTLVAQEATVEVMHVFSAG
jgi:DNA/RNA-binding domain of Phe-tRNA-synthetase-like protein